MIIVVNLERGGGVWSVLEGAWTLRSKQSFLKHSHTVLFSYLSRILQISFNSLSLSGKGLILRVRRAHHLKLTLCRTSQPRLERATRREPSPLSCVCFYRLAHLILCWKIQRSVLPLLSLNETEIFTHQHQPYMFLCYLSVEKRKQKQKDLWDWVAVIIYMY